MKRFLALIIVLIPTLAWSADQLAKPGYFKAKSGATCADTSGWTEGALQAAITAMGANSGVYICAGTYTGANLSAGESVASGDNGQFISGLTSDYSLYILDGTDWGYDFVVTGTALDLRNLTLIGPSNTARTAFYGWGDHTNVRFTNGRMWHNLLASSCTRCIFETTGASGEYPIRLGGDSTFNYCRFKWFNRPIGIVAGNQTFNNCEFTGFYNSEDYTGAVMRTADTYDGDTVLNNPVFSGNQLIPGFIDHIIDASECVAAGGTVTINNGSLKTAPMDGYGYNDVTINDSIYTAWKPISFMRSGNISLSVDSVIATYTALADYMISKGLNKGLTLFLDLIDLRTAGNWTTLASYIDAGFEVGSITSGHSILTNYDSIFTIVSSATTPTVEITTTQTNANPALWTGTLVCKEDGSAVGTFDLTAAAYDTLGELETAIEALSGGGVWTVTRDSDAGEYQKSVVLKTETHAVSGEGYAFSFENNLVGSTPVERFWYHEIVYYKKVIETALSTALGRPYVLKAMAYPGGTHDADLRAWVADQDNYTPLGVTKFLGVRGASGNSDSYTLYNIQINDMMGAAISSHIGTTAPTAQMTSFIEWAQTFGTTASFFLHTFAELSEANCRLAIDAMVDYPGAVQNFGDYASYIQASGLWADADSNGLRWTRTFTDGANYKLQSSSPAINAGTNLCDTLTTATDFAGNAVCSGGVFVGKGLGFDIGAYDYYVKGGLFQTFNKTNMFAPHRRLH